jgi:hypothetical protein
MFRKYFCLTVVFAFLFFLPGSYPLAGESASITASAYVLPAVGFETDANNNPQSVTPPDWLMRCPPSGNIICRIETENMNADYYFNGNENSQEIMPRIPEELSADSCIVTLIYSEN